MKVSGIKFFMNGFDGSGKAKWLSKFKFKGLKITDSGDLNGRIRFLIFPIIAGIENKSIEEIALPDFVKLLGITLWKAKSLHDPK